VHFLRKIQDWILKSENRFYVSLLNRSIQDHSDHGASKEPKNPPWARIFLVLLMKYDPGDIGSICLGKKRKIHFWIYESNLEFSQRNAPLVTLQDYDFLHNQFFRPQVYVLL